MSDLASAAEAGYAKDGEDQLDERTAFLPFIFRKGNEFEAAVLDHLRTLADVHTIEGADARYQARRDLLVASCATRHDRRN